MTLHLGFHGAAGTVTGSRHLVETDGTRVLVDAGMFQGLKELRQLNWRPPAFKPASLDHIVLTHTHIDHSGYLPRLVRDGFRGPVHCTPATLELARLLLLDAAKLQEEDADYANKKGFSKHTPALPLFTTGDAEAALERLGPVPYGTWFDLGAGVRARFHNAGPACGPASTTPATSWDRGWSRCASSGRRGRGPSCSAATSGASTCRSIPIRFRRRRATFS